MPLASFLFSSSYRLPTGFDLRQRGELVVVSGNVGIKDVAVDFRGFQRGVTQQLLERKGVSAAVHQILAGKSMTEKVRSRLRETSALVVAGNSLTQGAFCELFAALIAKQVVFRRPAADLLILPQDRHHLTAKGNDLNFLVLVVAGNDLMLFQIHIAVFDVADGSGTAARVQQEIDDNPIAIDRETAIRGRRLQKHKEVFIRVSLLDGLFGFVFGHLHVAILLPFAPIQESSRDPHIAGDGIYILRALLLLENDMLKAAADLEDRLFLEYWGDDVAKKIDIHDPRERIRYWLTQADYYAKEWVPSEYLFLDNLN